LRLLSGHSGCCGGCSWRAGPAGRARRAGQHGPSVARPRSAARPGGGSQGDRAAASPQEHADPVARTMREARAGDPTVRSRGGAQRRDCRERTALRHGASPGSSGSRTSRRILSGTWPICGPSARTCRRGTDQRVSPCRVSHRCILRCWCVHSQRPSGGEAERGLARFFRRQ